MARTTVVYCAVETSDGCFAVARTGGDLPDRVVLVVRTRERARTLADELNHAYITGWHDCLVEEMARRESLRADCSAQPNRAEPKA